MFTLALVMWLLGASPEPKPAPCVIVFDRNTDEVLVKSIGYAHVLPSGTLIVTDKPISIKPGESVPLPEEGSAAWPQFGWGGLLVTPPEFCNKTAEAPVPREL